MKTRYILLLTISAAAAATLLPGGAHGQDRAPARLQPRANTPSSSILGILKHGSYECALPGDAGNSAFRVMPSESFRIGTASSYVNAEGNGIYLLSGDKVVFTRGPKKNQRFVTLGENTLQKFNPDGSLSKLICTRLGGAS